MPQFYTAKELSEILKVRVETIAAWRKRGMPHVWLGERCVRYELQPVLDWLKQVSLAIAEDSNER